MRTGRRSLGHLILAVTLLGCPAPTTVLLAARSESPVQITIELSWRQPELPELPGASGRAWPRGLPILLEVSTGRIREVVAWPAAAAGVSPRAHGPLQWSAGDAARGKVRARLEVPLSANVLVRTGTQTTVFPVASLIEAPQRSIPASPVELSVQRLPWDAIEVDLGESDGTARPGATVPVTVGFNVLTPEPAEALVRFSAALRPIQQAEGEPIWRAEQNQVVATDVARTPAIVLNVPVPETTGTYVLELDASWEPIVALEGSRIGRLIRRRRTSWPGPSACRRRVSLVVLGDREPESEPAGPARTIDTLDLTARDPGSRLMAIGKAVVPAAGTGTWSVPAAALVAPAFRDRLRGWILGGPDAGRLEPIHDGSLAWSAIGLKTATPWRRHRLTLELAEGSIADLGLGIVEPADGDRPARVALDATTTGSTREPAGSSSPGRIGTWDFWPGVAEPVLVAVNRGSSQPLRIKSIQVEERPTPPAAPSEHDKTAAQRGLGLVLDSPEALERFGNRIGLNRPADVLRAARNLADHLTECGAGIVVLPGSLSDRPTRQALDGQAGEDPTGPDALGLTLDVLARRQCRAWLAIDTAPPLPGLPGPETTEAQRRGLVRIDGDGKPDGPTPDYWPLHPDVQAAWKQRIRTSVGWRARHPNIDGFLLQLGSGGTLLGGLDSGLDDATYARFLNEMLDPSLLQNAPGRDPADPNRHAARKRFVSGPGAAPWLIWRSRQLGVFYAELARPAAQLDPPARLALVTPVLDHEVAGREARRADRAGQSPLTAWKALGLDLEHWPSNLENLVLLRGLSSDGDPLALELAMHPELDGPLSRWPHRGLLQVDSAVTRSPAGRADELELRLAVEPAGRVFDEPLGHALAVLDAHTVLLPLARTAGRELDLARYGRVLQALPPAQVPDQVALRPGSGASVRVWKGDHATVLGLANDTPYTIRVDTTLTGLPQGTHVDDLGRGWRLAPESVREGKRLVLDLPAFGVTTIVVSAPAVEAANVTPYPMENLDAQLQSLATLRDRLTVLGSGGLPNGGFESLGAAASERPATGVLAQITNVSREPPAPPAPWNFVGEAPSSATLDRTDPHGGAACLLLDARKPVTSVVSPRFTPPGGTEWVVQTWLRSDPPDAQVRLWVEGEAAGQAISQVATVLAGEAWNERRIRFVKLPAGGLDWARIRVESVTPARIWVDDLRVTGPEPSSAQRRAQLVLTMALQAHREKRYADFARLAGSHWVRQPGVAAPTALGAAPPAEPIRTGDASDLPPGRRLR